MVKRFQVDSTDAGLRLDVYLKNHNPAISRQTVKAAILAGKVMIDGRLTKDPSLKVKAGQKVQFDFVPSEGLEPSQIPLTKVYENEDFLVIEKPAGLVIHPGAGITKDTLANALIAQYPNLAGLGDEFRPGIVHRLDKDTSGLLLIAKNEKAFHYAKRLFLERQIDKEYYALIVGRLAQNHGFIEKPLALNPKKRRVEISPNGRYALTEFKVMGIYEKPVTLDQYSLIRVKLHTGRTHQIRVHFASIGHPLAGDRLYGKGQPVPDGLTRQFLHASRLTFKMPDGAVLDLESQLPKDLQLVLNGLKPVS